MTGDREDGKERAYLFSFLFTLFITNIKIIKFGKIGWSGKIRSNFSKEQPVWLLGRCYHRKFSPISSMENSAEMTASLENKLYLNEPPQQQQSNSILVPTHHTHTEEQTFDSTVQEFGTDAIEGENGEYQWEDGNKSNYFLIKRKKNRKNNQNLLFC